MTYGVAKRLCLIWAYFALFFFSSASHSTPVSGLILFEILALPREKKKNYSGLMISERLAPVYVHTGQIYLTKRPRFDNYLPVLRTSYLPTYLHPPCLAVFFCSAILFGVTWGYFATLLPTTLWHVSIVPSSPCFVISTLVSTISLLVEVCERPNSPIPT
ncbi:hypothetical protein GGS21DRAFT_524831 [Xylaria nigripes]|nr:hypothetical protein GGS21DRAFT_524831 [Xylaria nigripes]